MKKKALKKLTLFSNEITKQEQNSIVGGDWIWDSQLGGYVYELPEVVIQGGCAYHPHGCCQCSPYPAGTTAGPLIIAEIIHYLYH